MNKPKYYISKDNEFVIENYNSAPTFSSFFPGIAGVFGCPMWVFYTNRGQCITSAGVRDKNGAIMEFQPANKAFHLASLEGFRTFLKVDGKFYEPFSERTGHPREMRITADRLKITETNKELKLAVEVTYFTVPGESFPGLARIVKVANLAPKKRKIEMLDGLPVMVPYGFEDSLLKRLSQTIEAWCSVENLDEGAPFCKLKVMPADAAETKELKAGNFFLSLAHQDGKELPVELIVHPAAVFGENTSLELPANFLAAARFKPAKDNFAEGFTPCAFSFKRLELDSLGSAEICSLFGQVEDLAFLNQISRRVSSRGYFTEKAAANERLIDGICAAVGTGSASKSFDLYAKQTFLDNVLRGGLPVSLGGKVIYLYYRKHGDMERDYNDFKLLPTYFSQGNGNYRDINQNRRNDIFFNPDVGADNIRRFFNLVQLDGYNPLIVLGTCYRLASRQESEALLGRHFAADAQPPAELLLSPFLLGFLLNFIERIGCRYKTSREAFAGDLLAAAITEEGASHGEGFWTDHFSYNTDLLESFACLFPERLDSLLFDEKDFTFFDNDHVVVPRGEKHRLAGQSVRQYGSVRTDVEKAALIDGRAFGKNLVRAANGRGEIFRATLIAKVLCLIVNKAASFDAAGTGLEMEADKPDWYDALNGLPGLFGSSLSETLELKRLAAYALARLTPGRTIELPAEVKAFIDGLRQLLPLEDAFRFWEEAGALKETFRRQTRFGVSGEELGVSGDYAAGFLRAVIAKCDRGVERVLQRDGNYTTYFINDAVEYEVAPGRELALKQFKQAPLPLFLEGFVHALKVERDKSIYARVKASPLYDAKLKMYKVNAPLKETPLEIGRARIFTPGWLENESVWLHMEYKYMLELLKAGQYQEFFADFKNVLVPFMDPKQYKRSILENSSFIVSSAHPNKTDHGRGFVARLSGASAEFLDIWLYLLTGKQLFTLDDQGKLLFQLKPVLPAWLFKKGALRFKLFSAIDVTYLHAAGGDSFGKAPLAYTLTSDGKEVELKGPFIPEPYSRLIRERKVSAIIAKL
ncbi:MAG: cellobiose phosphorylase [Candidatus Saganbacteria bacterium]|nr:cellobiose phosphorylase [Candidatus Saganbacteria bacterium]